MPAVSRLTPLLRRLEQERFDVSPLTPVKIGGFDCNYGVIDLSDWKLQFTAKTRIVHITADALAEIGEVALSDELIYLFGDRRDPFLIALVDGNVDETRTHIRRSDIAPPIALLDLEDQNRILAPSRVANEFRRRVIAQLPVSDLLPYETDVYVAGNLFFGRTVEKRSIVQKANKSHVIIGIRRIGKTSLLREVERIHRRNAGDAGGIIYIDCAQLTVQNFIEALASHIDPRIIHRASLNDMEQVLRQLLKAHNKSSSEKIILILDEVDYLVQGDAIGWNFFTVLRRLAQAGLCQFIFGGHRHLWNAVYDQRTPFFNFCQVWRLGMFTKQDAEELIFHPMENLDIGFSNRDAIFERIYSETGGHPNLIQYYCRIIAQHLRNSGERKITEDVFNDIRGNDEFRDRLLTSFVFNTSKLEQALVYSMVLELKAANGKSYNDWVQRDFIRECLTRHGVPFDEASLDYALRNLEVAGVLNQAYGGAYRFLIPIFPVLLLGYNDPSGSLNGLKKEMIYDNARW